jgi:hypothetical protein
VDGGGESKKARLCGVAVVWVLRADELIGPGNRRTACRPALFFPYTLSPCFSTQAILSAQIR